MSSTAEKVFLLSRRWPHHANHSGYDRLGQYIGKPLSTKPVPSLLLPERTYERLKLGMRGYDRTGIALELLAVRHMAANRNCLFHILYGDNCYNYLGAINGWRGNQIVASFHHPPAKFAEWIQRPERLKQLSAAIILGSNQHPSFIDILPRERVYLVPYAVDTSFFTPPANHSQRDENLCLFVGAHLRDLSTLKLVIEDAEVLAPHLKFLIVAPRSYLAEFKSLGGNYELFSNIPEQKLLNMYQRATLLIQPLLDAVANTVLLESMSCGLPMVVSDVGAVRDYAADDNAIFVPPMNPKAMLEAILRLINSPEKRQRMALSARERALEFDWHVIARRMGDVYEQILSAA